MDAVTAERPWGPNNPRWTPYAYGRLSDMLPSSDTIDSSYYVLLLSATTRPKPTAIPMRTATASQTRDPRVIAMRAEAFGPRQAHKVIELTAARSGPTLWRRERLQ